MPIPPLNSNGLLPVGLHEATLYDLRRQFGVFQETDRRIQLFGRLDELVGALQRSKLFVALIIDGSFVTAKPQPEDIDLIVVLHRDHDWTADLGASDYALVSRAALRRKFDFDVLLAAEGGADYERYIEFFGRLRDDASARKGVVRINL
jgi:hypothetical protein